MRALTFTLLLLTSICNAQWIHKIDEEYTTLTFAIDPGASNKEGGLNLGGEFALISYFGYVKCGVQVFPVLKGGYIDVTGGVGLNQKSSLFGVETRLFQGIRAGVIRRENYTYPLFGLDGGFDVHITRNLLLGMKGTYDKRADAAYWGANCYWRASTFITATIRL
jgi:hypothetical protein